MAPKEKPSKKNQQKAQAKVIEDRTFGLKNKNKSAKVQTYIKQVETGVKNSNGGIEAVSVTHFDMSFSDLSCLIV